jgi:EAL domain-containing protein (putative c-di-GMP-specific phosphodiesterase class I)
MAALAQPFEVAGQLLTVGASLGVVLASADEPELSAEALLRRADAAMYAGKRRGKGGMVVYEPGIAAALGDSDLPMLLATALRGGDGFDVYYQPVVRMDGGAPTAVAVEALARWTHPVLGAVPPDVFIAAAERAGLIAELDNVVLDRACREAAGLTGVDLPLDVHVNVCASRLCGPELELAVQAALGRYGLPGTRLVLEITETSRVPDLDAAAQTIVRLRALGIRFAIDDFGTGYNTLAQLHLLPVDIVKLCHAHTAVEQDRVETLCRSVVSICQALGLTVIAEGVESAPQAALLARLGCQLGQGYLYGRPAPLARQEILTRQRLDHAEVSPVEQAVSSVE